MRKHIKIECSPEVRELNEAVETADLITDYHFDWTTGEQLAGVLEGQGCPFHAADLRNKLAAVGNNAKDAEIIELIKNWMQHDQ